MTLRLGKYELLSRIAKGGMAETFRARLEGAAGVTKQVVIKKVLPSYAEDPEFLTAFINEARISASLSHGNIAQVFEFGQVEGDYFLAMEWVDGRSLAQILARTAELQIAFLPPSIAVFIAVEVLKGLHYAHTRTGDDGQPLQIVHRDLSPDNILVGFEGQVKVIDFGLARAALPKTSETAPGLVKGKFLYFSPEQASLQPVDARSDVFTLGVVLYRMLSGVLPFNGQLHVAVQAIQQGRFAPLQQVNPLVPGRLAEVVARAMEKDLSKRYGGALELQRALTSLLYREDPSFSSETVKDWMSSLFAGTAREEEVAAPPLARPAEVSGRPAPPPLDAFADSQPSAPRQKPPSLQPSAAPAPPAPARPPRAAPVQPSPAPAPRPIAIALAGVAGLALLGGLTFAALRAEPAPIARPIARPPALKAPPVFEPPPAAPDDSFTYPATVTVHGVRHRLRLEGRELPVAQLGAGAELVERQASDEHSPLLVSLHSADPAHDGEIRLVLQRPTPLPRASSARVFDWQPFEPLLKGATRHLQWGRPPTGLSFVDAMAVIDSRSAQWITVENVPPAEKVKLTLRPLDPVAWQGRPRPPSVVVVWKRAFGRLLPPPGGDWPDELDRAVLTADRPLVVEHATALAFAFADRLVSEEKDSVLVEVFGTGEPASKPDPAAVARAARLHLEKTRQKQPAP